jgi:hypothetical protein
VAQGSSKCKILSSNLSTKQNKPKQKKLTAVIIHPISSFLPCHCCHILLLRQARSGIVWDSSPLAQGLFPWPTGERSRVMTYCLPTSKFMVYKQPTKRPPALSSSSRPSPGRMRDSLLSIKLFYLTPSTCLNSSIWSSRTKIF